MESILSLATNNIYEIEVKKHGENQMPCPECSQNRKKKNAKSFSYSAEKEVGYCNHCEARFVKHVPFEKKNYVKPELKWENYTKLSDKVVKWFEGRGISQKTLLTMRIGEKKEWLPQTQKEENCIMFPYFRNGELLNVKFRDGKKNFKLTTNAELMWYNYDAIIRCGESGEPLIICEGEIDVLSFVQAGFDNVVSVPNGAGGGKMEYFDSSFDDLSKVKSFILATDNDLKGIELKNELVRRLGIERCSTTNFKQHKDANEVLVEKDAETLKSVITNAKNIRLSDVYTVADFQNEIDAYFENGIPDGLRIGINDLDEKIRWQTGRLAVVTGYPGSGKSEFIDFILSKLNVLHGWKYGYYSPESMPLPLHYSRIFEKFVGKQYKKNKITEIEKEVGDEYINNNVFWVAPEMDFKTDEILSRFEYLIRAKGCKAFVIDPFNRIEQESSHSDNAILYTKKTLGKLISFSKRTDCLMILIAHPRKPAANDGGGKMQIPSMSDISGSSDFWNMTDYGISVGRAKGDDDKLKTFGSVKISKTKYNATMGDTGTWNFHYNINNGRYCQDTMDEKQPVYDNSNWITKEEHTEPKEVLPLITPELAFCKPPSDNWEDDFDY